MAVRFVHTRRSLPVPAMRSVNPFSLSLSGLLSENVQQHQVMNRESEEFLGVTPCAGDVLRRVTEIAVWPAVGGTFAIEVIRCTYMNV
ncbi:unnamed protein product [Thelazia callipaeda]|uniref:Uncharacterized protein n=1 Tax=Thelazia callipaeda TaxID=103827 RepID=A0A0N5CQM9_THECL|nr:unnamed protein product [Thelazia callipaeda]